MNNAKSDETSLDAYFVSNLSLGYTFNRIPSVKSLRVGCTIYNIFNEKYCSNGYAGAGYYVDDNGEKNIYRYAGYAAQAPTHVMATVTMKF
jgi:iron complex outermembrane receptor protein